MVSTEIKKRRSSCGRGVLKFKSWKPLPRPGELNQHQERETERLPAASGTYVAKITQPQTLNKGSRNDLRMVMAKYSYKANPERPGGFDELTIKQTEKLYFHCAHPQNPLWLKAENEEGIIGYVPANYIIELESKPSRLPWLENKRLEREAEREKQEEQSGTSGFGQPQTGELPAKKYISAYDSQASAQASDFGCELCGKTFNGPQPYRMHMASKAHKEEVEAQKYR
eukprot:Seg402.6 transcript_id=Seg402.6/GoldUCD/mRNA.D3Y31 product="hypothetical protein" protein_id=Seg402.6/GoldUCD/D3Y31